MDRYVHELLLNIIKALGEIHIIVKQNEMRLDSILKKLDNKE